ncbi:MAG: hypothetical protein ACXWWD_06130 [Chitinophagaceae bacterium]
MKRLLHFMIFVSVRLIYCGIFVISFCHHIGAQEMGIRLYTTKDGLPSAFVIGTYQDKLGYLWVSTIEGSCRFDGNLLHTMVYRMRYLIPDQSWYLRIAI